MVGRRLGLGLRLGRWQRLYQPLQQLQSSSHLRWCRWSGRRRWCRRCGRHRRGRWRRRSRRSWRSRQTRWCRRRRGRRQTRWCRRHRWRRQARGSGWCRRRRWRRQAWWCRRCWWSVASVVTGPRLYPLRAASGKTDSATGRTTPHIAVAHLIQTGLRQIGLEVALAVIHLPNARPAPGNRLLDRVEGSTVSLPQVAV